MINKIHQVWLGHKNPPLQWTETWRKKHKKWEYKLWREEDIDDLNLVNREIYDKYKELGDYAGMSDVARVEILWRYGGIYLDADTACREKLDKAPFLKYDFFTVKENERNLANGIMGSMAGHPLLEIYIKELGKLKKLQPAWENAGPMLLTKCVEIYGKDKIHILPAWTFLPETHDNKEIKAEGKVYADHFWGSTLKSKYNYDNVFTVSYNIMAHRKREGYVKELKKLLPDVKVIWDTQNNIWHTRKKCLRDHIKQGCDFGITIQDDSILCENFQRKAENFINGIGDPFGIYNYFYAGRLKRQPIDEALLNGRNYIKGNEIASEICFAFPTSLMQEMIDVCDEKRHIKAGNMPEADWVMDFRYMPTKKLNVYFSVPSLVDHRCTTESLYYNWTKEELKKQEAGRRCWYFDGTNWDIKSAPAKEYEYTKKGIRHTYKGAFYKIISKRELTDHEIKDIITAVKSFGTPVRRVSFKDKTEYLAI